MAQQAESIWQSRIVGTDQVAPDQLQAHPQNWRIHPAYQQDALEAVLDQVGWIDQVIVNQRTGNTIDGHLRVILALRRGESRIPVTYVDLSEEEESLILATFDPLGSLAITDASKLEDVLSGIPPVDSEALDTMLADLARAEGIHPGSGPPSLDDLADDYADPDDDDFWAVVRIKLSPEEHLRYREVLGMMDGTNEDAQFRALIAWAAGQLGME